jgi:hypothetical protein
MKLYEISQHYIEALDALRDADEQTRLDTLEGLGIEDDFKGKSINLAGYFLSLDAESEALKEAIRRIQARQKAVDNHSASLKAYLLHNMLRTGITSIKCPEFEVKLAKCPVSVEIMDESLLPDNLMRIKKEPDKTAIKQFILDNGQLDGARLVDDKMRLLIK